MKTLRSKTEKQDKRKVLVIMGKLTDKPKLLGSDISPKQVLEANANDVAICLYSVTMETYRALRYKANSEALDALEKAFIGTPLGYEAKVFPITFQEAGI